MNKVLRTVWILPFLLVLFMIIILSLRQLSDPDIGSHLRAGKWIVENQTVPGKDTFTYTVNSHDYVDMNWLFQVMVYSVFLMAGYKGLSLFVMAMILLLVFLLLFRIRRNSLPLSIITCVLFPGILVMETRIALRPELFTFIFITLFLLLLDDYYHHSRKRLFFLPVIMLFWCNIHGLFVLGLGITVVYLIGLFLRDKKPDKYFLLWMAVTFAVCLINPYFFKGLTFPLELFTRLDTTNIFHSHIKELQSFFNMERLFFKDILFLSFLFLTVAFSIFNWRRRPFHDFFLLMIFALLAVVSIRNIALFAVIGMPLLGFAVMGFSSSFRDRIVSSRFSSSFRVIRAMMIIFMIILPVAITLRLITNAYYLDNREYTKTGTGPDLRQLPEKAAAFMIRNRLEGRMINGISLGGWLSWRLPQPVFIDGRLEVIREPLYEELTKSWKSGLSSLADKYSADLILYNYTKYFPWTVQLAEMDNWRLRYIDGLNVVFVRQNTVEKAGELNTDSVFREYGISPVWDDQTVLNALNGKILGSFPYFISGFYKKPDLHNEDLLNIGSFFLQLKQYAVSEKFFLEILRRSTCSKRFIYYALADIYQAKGDAAKAEICYREILKFDPENRVAGTNSGEQESRPSVNQGLVSDPSSDPEARKRYNEANESYRHGNVAEALQLYDEAIRISPGYYKAYNNRGIVKAAALKKFREAIDDFSQAIKLNPDYGDAYLGRGTSKLELRDLEGACSDWQKAVALGNKQAVTLIKRYCPGR